MPHDALKGWYVILLRPALTRGALLRAMKQHGARPVLLPGLRLSAATDAAAANHSLELALRTQLVLATSPAAVHFARKLPAWRYATTARFAAVGGGTAQALRRAGIAEVIAPEVRQDSDGLLALLQEVSLSSVGLITAPGGRDRLATVLGDSGVTVQRADVYRRLPPRLDKRHLRSLAAVDGPSALLHSSAEALANLHHALPASAWRQLLQAQVIPSSERLDVQARELGFRVGPMAASATPCDLLTALESLAI